MIYSTSIQNLFLGQGILVPMGMSTNGASNVTISLTVYGGTQPNSANILANWGTFNTSYLYHKTNVVYYQPNYNNVSTGNYITLYSLPDAQTAIANGNANWVIIWTANHPEANITGATIPSNSFIIGPVSNVYSNGIVKFDNTNFVSGNTYNVADSLITVSLS